MSRSNMIIQAMTPQIMISHLLVLFQIPAHPVAQIVTQVPMRMIDTEEGPREGGENSVLVIVTDARENAEKGRKRKSADGRGHVLW